jgi:hydrogenase expression/formation protein HypC
MCLAIPGKVLSIEGDDPLLRTGKVSFGGAVKPVNLAYLPEAQVGDWVVVHVGFAISRLDEAEANQVFEYLREMGELEGGEAGPAAEGAGQGPGQGPGEPTRGDIA